MNYKTPEIFSVGGGIIVERGFATSFDSSTDQVYYGIGYGIGASDDEFTKPSNL